jgi:AcrR family transcriptional regulator
MSATRIAKTKKSSHRKRLDPRKPPLQSRSTETVNAVLEAAARILERYGFEGYTTNAIAERAGVSIGSLYQYFPGKDAVTVALIEREAAMLLADVAPIESVKGYKAAFDHLIRSAVAHQMRRPRLARLLDFEEARLPIAPRIQHVADVLHTALISTLNRPGVRYTGNVEEAAFDVLAIVKGLVDAAGEREETDAAHLEDRVRRAVYGYLGIR